MIKNIHIKNCASYDETGCEINDLDKVNMIYGDNGSGKTTLSNLLKNSTLPDYKDCAVEWHNHPMDVVVYNKQFRDENFTQGDIKGVFTLGTATQQDIETIHAKLQKRSTIADDGIRQSKALEDRQQKLDEIEEDFKELVWRQYYKNYKADFKPAFRGYSYKATFKNRLIELYQQHLKTPNPNARQPKITNLVEKAQTIFADKTLVTMPLIAEISNDRLLSIERDEAWQRSIIGRQDVDIAEIIQRLNISDWVNQGKQHIDDDMCPFCQQQTITANFRQQLEGYFDDTYTRQLEQIHRLADSYNHDSEQVVAQLEDIERVQTALDDSQLDMGRFIPLKKAIEQLLKTNQQKMTSKQKQPSQHIVLESCGTWLSAINEVITQANERIYELNQIVDNFKREEGRLINEFWQYLTIESQNEVANFLQKRKDVQIEINNLNHEVQQKRADYIELSKDIATLQNNLTDIQPTINRINDALQAYGIEGFYIAKSEQDGFYQIKRQDGTLAQQTLSEGEVTFITFLYFLQLAKGATQKDKLSNHRVIVIDDPISSLDSTMLSVVSTLTKSLIKEVRNDATNIKQLIILTHNKDFYKQVTGLGSTDNIPISHWHLHKQQGISNIAAYGTDNPI